MSTPTAFTAVWPTPAFYEPLDALARGDRTTGRRVRKTIGQLLEHAAAADRKPLTRNAKRRLFRTRVDDDRRLIDEPLDPSRPGELALLYVGRHDPALAWGERYAGDTAAALAQGSHRITRVADLRGLVRHRRVADDGTRERTWRAVITAPGLAALGVPAAYHAAVLATPLTQHPAALGLAEDVAERLASWRDNTDPGAPMSIPVPGYETPPPVAITADTLTAVFRVPLVRWLARMTPEQQALARRPSAALAVIKGAAGSGKTVVGVRRVEYLQQRRSLLGDRPILFTCYNQVLAHAARQMLEDTLGRPLAEAGVEVWTAYQLFEQVRAELGLPTPGRYVGAAKLLPLVKAARARAGAVAAPVAGWSDRAVLDEILEVIYGRVLTNEAAYRAANRRGRGRRLDARGRAAVWEVYQHFRERCDARGVAPWDQLPARLAAYLAAHPPASPRYAAVVVDEAQDLLPSGFQVLRALQGGDTDHMLILGDAAQNVYRSGFRWGHTGLDVTGGHVTTLARCHRSTPNIIAAARPLVAELAGRLEQDLVLPEVEGPAGPPVTVTTFGEPNAEAEHVALTIAAKIAEEDWPASSIGVLADDPAVRGAVAQALRTLGCPVEDLVKPGGVKRIDAHEASVKLLSVPGAKGIEFPVLFVAGVTEAGYPTRGDRDERERSARLLYTALTRGAWEVHVSACKEDASALLDVLTASATTAAGR